MSFVPTLSEEKYTRQPVSLENVSDFEQKLERFKPPKKQFSIQRVLISVSGASQSLEAAHVFDRILGLEEVCSGRS